MIPKIVHYCWFGNKEKSNLVKKCIASWKKYLPDYKIKEWNEDNSPANINYINNALKNKKFANASNLVRLHALYSEGGIYFDTDIEVIRRFDSFLNDECFLGFQTDKTYQNWINNAVIGSIPKNQFIKRLYDSLLHNFDGTESASLSSPKLTTTVLKKMGLNNYGMQNIGTVKIYPKEYFYPYPWDGKFTDDCIKKNTYCIHHWEKSWLK